MKFNFQRFINLVRRDLIFYKKPLLYSLALFLILIPSLGLISYSINGKLLSRDFWEIWYVVFLMGGGLLFTSVVFWEFKTPAGRMQYLSLPASHFEKWLSRWIYSLVFYPSILLSIFWLLYKVMGVFLNHSELTETNYEIFGILLLIYYLIHSVVFYFAIRFNNYSAAKGMIVSSLIAIASVFLFAFLFRIIFHDAFNGFRPEENIHFEATDSFKNFVEIDFTWYLERVLKYLVPPIFWVASFFRLSEKEV